MQTANTDLCEKHHSCMLSPITLCGESAPRPLTYIGQFVLV